MAAITLDGFSIREYTAQIRAKSVEKCWPFDGNPKEMKKQVVEEMLPPLTCKKFRWWSDEFEKAGLGGFEKPAVLEVEDDDKEVMNCCSSLRTHINRCLKTKEKKIQRKRSIVEIFAIAPQIQANCSDDDDEEILSNVKKKKKKKKKKSNEIVKKGMVKKGSSFKKEKIHKFKGSMQLALVGKLKSSVKGKKKLISKSKSSSKCNVTKIILASKLTKQNQKPIRKSLQGILKKVGRVTGKRSAVGNMQSDDPKKRRHLVDKHVRFSGNDYILGHSSSLSFCDHVVVSSVNHEPEKADHVSPTDGTQLKENEALNERDGCIEPSTFWSLNRSRQDRGQGLSEESVTWDLQPQENLHPLSHDRPISSHNTSYPDISWVRKFFQECGIPIQRSVAVDSTMISTSEFSALSVTKSRNADGKHPLLSQDVSQQLSSCDMQYPFLQLSPKDLMTRICSLVDPKQKKAVSCEDKFVEDDFVGLPLNSQGELIKLHSNGRGGLNKLKKQTVMNTSENLPVKSFMHPESSSHHLDKGDGCSVETTLPKENHDIPSRMSQPTHQQDLDLNKMSISSCACSHYNQPQNQIDKEKSMLVEKSDSGVISPTRPTMRLMGKDVTVGKNNKEFQGSEENKVWTDKNVINEQRRDALVGNSSLSRNFETINTSSGKWKETRIQPLGPPGVPTRPYIPQMNAVDPRFSQTYHNWSASMMPQSRPHLTMENQSVQMPPFTCSVPSKELMSGNFRMAADSPNLSSHMRSFAYSQYPCQCTRPNSTQLLYDQGLAHGSSGFRFPFVSPPCGECPQQSRPESSSKTLPHWMLNVSQQKGSQFVPSEYATRAQNHPYSTPGSNYSPVSSHDFTSMISQPLRHAKPNLSDTYWVQRPLIPALPGFRPNSSINASYGHRLYPKNKPKPHTVRCKDLERAKRTKKRPTDKIDDSIKHPTNPFLVVPAETSELIGMGNGLNLKLNPSLIHKQGAPRRDANTDNQIEVEPSVRSSIQNTRASVLDAYMDHGRYAEHSSSAVVNISSTDTVARSGPTKLSAGAKHILKPSPNPDQDNSRLIHSTIPIGQVNNSGKVSELQKKPSKIYKL